MPKASGQGLIKTATDPIEKLRLANNLAFAMQRASRLEEGLAQLVKTIGTSEYYNEYIALNLAGRIQPTADEATNTITLRVLGTWLLNGSKDAAEYDGVYKTYLAFCKKLSLNPKEFEDKPMAFAQVVTVVDGDKEVSLLEPIDSVLEKLGKPEGGTRYSETLKDMLELFWQSGSLRLLTERESVLRVTSYSNGAAIILRPRKESSQERFKISVGMTTDEVGKIVDLSKGIEVSLVRGGEMENWVYFRGAGFGVYVKGGKIAGVTATPARTQ